MTRTVLGRSEDVEPGGSRVFSVPGKRVLVVNEDGAFKAYKDFCPHAAGSLKYNGTDVVCVRHGARFDAKSGEAKTAPAMGMGLSAMDIRVEDDALVLYEEATTSPWVGQF